MEEQDKEEYKIHYFKERIKKIEQSSSSDDGFTLIEVVIGTLLMAIVAVGVFAPLFWSQQTIGGQREISVASNFVRESLDEIRYTGNNVCSNVISRISMIDGSQRTSNYGREITMRVDYNENVCTEASGKGVVDISVYAENDLGDTIEQSRVDTRVFVQ